MKNAIYGSPCVLLMCFLGDISMESNDWSQTISWKPVCMTKEKFKRFSIEALMVNNLNNKEFFLFSLWRIILWIWY